MFTEEKYRELLNAAVQFNKAHRINPLEQGNLFTVLDMENKEVSAHSAFLYFVFKPFQKEDDEYDYDNLRELLKELLNAKEKKYGCTHKDVNDYKYLDIRREVPVDFGRLDFVITADNEIFVIELKVWAGEQHEQIPRYRQYLIKQGADKNNIFFLTPLERPSETGESINLTLKDDIKPILESISNNRRNECHEKYATMIEQYICIIDKLTQGENYMKETLDVIHTADELSAVERLIDNRNCCLQEVMNQFFTKLRDRLTDKFIIDGCPNAELVPPETFEYGYESIKKYYSEPNRYPALAYEIDDCKLQSGCKLKENIKLYFFIEVSSNLYCGITPRKITGQGDNDLQVVDCKDAIEPYQTFIDNLKKIKRTGHTRTFAIWEYLKVGNQTVNFSIGALNSGDSIVRLLSKDTLLLEDKIIEELAIEIKNTYKTYCEAIFDK